MFRKLFLYPLAIILGLSGIGVLVAQEPMSVPAGIFKTGEAVYAKDTNNLAGTPEFIMSATGVKVGATSGTEITQIVVTSLTTTAESVAINQCDEIPIDVSGVTTADEILWNAAYDQTSEPVPITGIRVSVAGQVEVTFCNVGTVMSDPVIGTVNLVAIRS